MDGVESATQPVSANSKASWPTGFLNPYAQVAIGAMLVTISELMLKKGATAAAGTSWLGIDALASLWTWGGIVTYILSFVSWLHVLRYLPLGVAFSLIKVVHFRGPLASWAFLHNAASLAPWAGLARVLPGLSRVT